MKKFGTICLYMLPILAVLIALIGANEGALNYVMGGAFYASSFVSAAAFVAAVVAFNALLIYVLISVIKQFKEAIK